MKKIGNGFHDGPPSVTRSRWAISRPQRIHAHGSYVGVDGNSSVSADTARQPTMIKHHLGAVALERERERALRARRFEPGGGP